MIEAATAQVAYGDPIVDTIGSERSNVFSLYDLTLV
jgi:hypothetical protein